MIKHRNETLLVQLLERVVPTLKKPVAVKKSLIEKIDINIANLPKSFNNFKICHLSDLHNTNIFNKNPDFLDQLKQEKIDALIVSGDICNDGQNKDSLKVFDLLSQFIPYQNMYLVTGNHDFVSYKGSYIFVQDFKSCQKLFESKKINVLRNQAAFIKKGNKKIAILGIDDPELQKHEDKFFDKTLKNLTKNIDLKIPKILISHRPEKFEIYSKHKIDLIFTGHAHGGQIILFNRGLVSPNQGIFPKYTSGLYQKNQSQMVVSPGVSNNHSIPRFNNPGKIFVVELHSNK